jgi:hypothetical protein
MLHGSLPVQESSYQVRGMIVDPRDANRVLMATGSRWATRAGVWLSTNGGDTWRKVLTAAFAGNGEDRWTGFILSRSAQGPDLVAAASEGDGVFLSRDNGATWEPAGLTGRHCTDIRFDRTDSRRIWVCTRPFKGSAGGKQFQAAGEFFRSDDGGKAWTPLAQDSPSEILQDPVLPTRLYGIVDNTVARSDDLGNSWAPAADGLPHGDASGNTSDSRFQALAAGPDFILTASAHGTFYRLAEGATRWQRIDRMGIQYNYEGQEWFRERIGGFGWALGSITVDPRNPGHLFFTDWFAASVPPDAGKHWSLSFDGIEDTVIHCLEQDPGDPGVVHLGMADDGYFYSQDGGERFTPGQGISNNVKCISVARSQPSRVYAVGPKTFQWEANQVFVSRDRGHTWKRSPMTGLPDMDTYRCNSIAASPTNPLEVYLAVSEDVGEGKGGVYHSVDAGRTWTWMGQGLPAGKAFFTNSIWGIGRELAVDAGGALVAISSPLHLVYRFDPAARQWVSVDTGGSGSPGSVVADPFHPGRFFAGLSGSGVMRSDDAGITWRSVYPGHVHHVAVDEAVPDRVAAGTDDGVALSLDGGKTWSMLDRRLPYRLYNEVAFAGDRIIVGSGGSGAFWMPIKPDGSEPVHAHALVPAPALTAQGPAPTLANGNMSAGTATPEGWGLWTGKGQLAIVRDTTTYKAPPASLRLDAVGGYAEGTASEALQNLQQNFTISGWARTIGQITESQIAIQEWDAVGKQIGWVPLANVRTDTDWTYFSQDVQLAAGTTRAIVVITLHGAGQAWIDDVATAPAGADW